MLYEERSRRALGDFDLTRRIDGFWDRGNVEIDLVAFDEDNRRIRFGSCKRNADKLLPDVAVLETRSNSPRRGLVDAGRRRGMLGKMTLFPSWGRQAPN